MKRGNIAKFDFLLMNQLCLFFFTNDAKLN
jgi:hypothetical protein